MERQKLAVLYNSPWWLVTRKCSGKVIEDTHELYVTFNLDLLAQGPLLILILHKIQVPFYTANDRDHGRFFFPQNKGSGDNNRL